MNNAPVYLNQLGIVCALGCEHDAIREGLYSGNTNTLTYTDTYSVGTVLPVGMVKPDCLLERKLSVSDRSDCNLLMLEAMKSIQNAFDLARQDIDPLRIGIVLGTSTGGISEGAEAIAYLHEQGDLPNDYCYEQQEMSAPAEYLARYLKVDGPAYVISTACSSGAKALASARRLLRMDICDIVIAGGVDSLCDLTVNGFSSLESVSTETCQPFSSSRKGINIGEGAALFLLSREEGPVVLAGVGECSDAYHISAPHPEGVGAVAAMSLALADADISAEEINYLNLHGTATLQNDQMESKAVAQVLGTTVACSSTKPFTGHTLGAAGAIEAGIAWLTLTQTGSSLPLHLWDRQRDPELMPLNFVEVAEQSTDLNYIMSNSFAFGGNNISLILERVK